MKHYNWSLHLTLTAPFLSGGSENLSSEYDSILFRNERGRIAFSGAHIAGHFRHFLEAVHRAEETEGIANGEKLVPEQLRLRWFGLSGNQMRDGDTNGDIDWNAQRGYLTFRDIPLKNDTVSYARTRIAVGDKSASAVRGAWQVLEQTHRTGEKVEFQEAGGRFATVELFASKKECKVFEAAFEQFKQAIVAIGANKGQGFGRVRATGLSLECKNHTKLAIPNIGTSEHTSFRVAFSISHPLLVEPEQYSGNLFRSSSSISGAVIKAAIAEFGERVCSGKFQNEFGTSLAEMSIGNFSPFAGDGVSIPLVAGFDIVYSGKKKELCSVSDVPPDDEITFFVDMKNKMKSEFIDIYKPHQPAWINRTRTQITAGAFTAEKHKLFNYQCVKSVGTQWQGRVELAKEDPKAVQLLEFLKAGYIQIGRLRSRITDASIREDQDNIPTATPDKGFWRIVLQTPAQLLGLEDLKNLGSISLRELYIGVLEKQLGTDSFCEDSFQFYTRHAWWGGAKAARFLREIDGEKKYYPFLLTQPGSVFIIKPVGDIKDKLNGLARFGFT